jgi:hypothetical protein
MSRMDTLKKLPLLFAAALVAVALVATPALAQEDGGADADAGGDVVDDDAEVPEGELEVDEAEADEEGRPAIAATPRDRLGLLLLAALVGGGVIAYIGMKRQLGGERPKASGEFRWR